MVNSRHFSLFFGSSISCAEAMPRVAVSYEVFVARMNAEMVYEKFSRKN